MLSAPAAISLGIENSRRARSCARRVKSFVYFFPPRRTVFRRETRVKINNSTWCATRCVTFARVHLIRMKPIIFFHVALWQRNTPETRDRTRNANRTIPINYPEINPRRGRSFVPTQTRKNERRSTAVQIERGATRVISTRSCDSALDRVVFGVNAHDRDARE